MQFYLNGLRLSPLTVRIWFYVTLRSSYSDLTWPSYVPPNKFKKLDQLHHQACLSRMK